MPHQNPKRQVPVSQDPAKADEWAADRIRAAHRLLRDAGPRPNLYSERQVTDAERAALMMLVRHFGWVMTSPGRMVRVPRPSASAATGAPITGAPSAAGLEMVGDLHRRA
jgi:hypothetical protein